jgi:uncharacterized protein (TIGR02246 family)
MNQHILNQRILMACAIAILSWANGELTVGQEGQQSDLRLKENANGKGADASNLNAIRSGSEAFVDAFNRGDAKAVAMLWAADGDYIDEMGRKFQGRAAIEKEYADFFSEHRGVKIRIVIDSLRLIGSDAAVEDGRAILDPAPAGAPAATKYTAVHAKIDGQWLMVTVRDTRMERPSAYGNIADLEWLIGTWTAEENGSRSESVCRWIANKSFVERSHTTTQPDGTVLSGVQIIGWNPERGHVQSWNFSADGGHAIGVWTQRERGWAAEVQGVTGDGALTTAVNLLTRLDDNAYVWHSIQRTAGGRSLADTDEVVLRRRPATELKQRESQDTTRTAERQP